MKIQSLDRRFIFLILFLAICLSILFPRKLHIAIEPYVQQAYHTIDSLQPGDRVLMSFDYGPSTSLEVHPATLAILRHCFEKGAPVVMYTLWNEGLPFIQDAIEKVCIPLSKKENVDYVNLGFKWGGLSGSSVIEGMGSNLGAVFPVTTRGIPYNQVPLLQGVKGLKDFKVLVSISAGAPGIDEYIRYANARYGIPIIGVVTRVGAPKEYPYLNGKQLYGLCAGLVGGAEYEELIGRPGDGTAGLFSLSIANLTVIGFIIIGNMIYFSQKVFKK